MAKFRLPESSGRTRERAQAQVLRGQKESVTLSFSSSPCTPWQKQIKNKKW